MIQIDHAAYQKKLRSYSEAQLHYVYQDATEAARLNPDSEKAGYWQDEAHYAAMELSRRGLS